LTSGGAKTWNIDVYAGCTATSWPCRCVLSSLISTPAAAAVALRSSQYALLVAAFFRSMQRASHDGTCTPA
jgi:hypothetical protein